MLIITYNNEGSVIMSVIVRPKARLAVVFSPSFNGCVVPSVDGCPVCLFMPHRQKKNCPVTQKKSHDQQLLTFAAESMV